MGGTKALAHYQREKTEVFYLFDAKSFPKMFLFFRQLGPAQGTGVARGEGGMAVGVSASVANRSEDEIADHLCAPLNSVVDGRNRSMQDSAFHHSRVTQTTGG